MDIQELVARYNMVCNSGAQCTAALQALNGDTDCINVLDNDDTATYCSGSCVDLINAVFNICPDVSDDI